MQAYNPFMPWHAKKGGCHLESVGSQLQTHTLLWFYSLNLIIFLSFFFSSSMEKEQKIYTWRERERNEWPPLYCNAVITATSKMAYKMAYKIHEKSHLAARICTDKNITRCLQDLKTQACCQQWQTRIPEIRSFYQA